MKWTAIASVILALMGCGGGSDAGTTGAMQNDSLDTVAQVAENNLMQVGGKLFSIPSPVQTALLIRKLGLPYEKGLPMATDMAERMATKDQRALALGAYGADLAYLTVHKDAQRALTTLQTVQKLSAALELANAFDQQLIADFKRSANNEDSLLRYTGKAFRAADQYLKNNKRDDVSALVLAGGWIEGMFLSMHGTTGKADAELTNRLGEQRKTLQNLIALLESTDTEKTHGNLIAGLKDVLSAYDGVTISYEYRPPSTDAEKKVTYVNSVSTVTMTPEQFKAITDKVNALRATLTA